MPLTTLGRIIYFLEKLDDEKMRIKLPLSGRCHLLVDIFCLILVLNVTHSCRGILAVNLSSRKIRA
jgi:hypothetical protein